MSSVDHSATDATLDAREREADRFYGKYRGLVTDVDDPLQSGRIKATVPDVLGDVPCGWALPCAPYTGEGVGLYTIPPVDAGVWIEFEAGDTSRPIWSGGWWGETEVPKDERDTPSMPTRKILRSHSGLIVSLDDEQGTLTISDRDGTNLIRIEVDEGTIEVDAATRVVLEAPLIKHGESATHPAVFGDDLVVYLNQLVAAFNTHIHPGELAIGFLPVTPAPPVPPFPAATPSLLSTKNLVE